MPRNRALDRRPALGETPTHGTEYALSQSSEIRQNSPTCTDTAEGDSHGDGGRGGQDAAFQQALDNFRSTVIGHFHNQAGVRWWANPEFRVFGLSVGCGIDVSRIQFEYGRKFSHKPILGCGVVLGGKQAYFEPWLLPSR